MRATRILALCVALCGAAGCGNKEKQARREQLIELKNDSSDPDIAAAIKKSRETVGDFLAVLKSPGPNQRQFLVRREFPTATAGKTQILIVNNVTFDGQLLHGKLDDNTARPGSSTPRSGEVSFPPSEVCDWMYNDGGKAAGGYMLRALKLKMTPEEWAKISAQVTFKDE